MAEVRNFENLVQNEGLDPIGEIQNGMPTQFSCPQMQQLLWWARLIGGCVFRETVQTLKPWILMVLADEEEKSVGEEIVVHLAEMLLFVAFACASTHGW